MNQAKALLFDWDGTLIDSFPAGYRASMTVLRHFGIDVDRERFLDTYSPNWYESYEKLGVPREDWPKADRMWRESYHEHISEPFPFVFAMLRRLSASGRTLGVVTSGNRDRVERELQRFELGHFFEVVVCFEDTVEKKPHPQPLMRALESLDVEPHSAVFVGDRPEDVLMGRRVGTFTVGVESEYGPRAALEEAGPDLLLPDAGHLPRRLGLEEPA